MVKYFINDDFIALELSRNDTDTALNIIDQLYNELWQKDHLCLDGIKSLIPCNDEHYDVRTIISSRTRDNCYTRGCSIQEHLKEFHGESSNEPIVEPIIREYTGDGKYFWTSKKLKF